MKALDITPFVINWCHDNNTSITNLKLQKLLYFIQGEYCRHEHGRIIDDDFYAWQLGPVIPAIYDRYSIYSAAELPREEVTTLSYDIKNFLASVLSVYGKHSAWSLVDLSHEQDPWKYNYQIFGKNSLIPFDAIREFFEDNDT